MGALGARLAGRRRCLAGQRACTGRARGALARVALWLLGLALLTLVAGCAAAVSSAGGPTSDEQRLLPRIVHQQEARVREAQKALQAAEDDAKAIRLRQRILEQYGRPDLAAALESQAADREAQVVQLRQRLADEQVALNAYRDFAARSGVAIPPGPEPSPRRER